MLRKLWFAILTLLLLQGCGSGDDWVVYNEVEIANDWNQKDALRIVLNPSHEKNSNLYLTITHSPKFKYENIYLKYTLSQQGKILSEDMVSIPLMSNDGLWTGDKQGNNYISSQLIGTFDLTQPISLEVQQHSRDDKLGEVMAVGIGVLSAI
ncbi:MAG: gliding motility-associated lipoprotein GldH [Saprospiraceae bacterium]|jgi:gliding motility-associated lipoprotein GldH